ncbi:cysteine-rich and transmembrane domain-containing protein 1 isoform X1 [Panthera leo]|uniref:cysteine-rich and transmembrane domain-containing protein 1 isoform X1 n=1 Tax=Panthera leo TaxID=9689 RepID=UPI001C69FB35|nr:cysteine-rich and transmembrane domain-containing protein 1 isoform X1 [Panthera leo]
MQYKAKVLSLCHTQHPPQELVCGEGSLVLTYKSPEKGKFLYLRFCWSSQLSLPGAVAGLSDGPQSSLQPENTRIRDTEGPPCSRGRSRDNVKPMDGRRLTAVVKKLGEIPATSTTGPTAESWDLRSNSRKAPHRMCLLATSLWSLDASSNTLGVWTHMRALLHRGGGGGGGECSVFLLIVRPSHSQPTQ